jgi:hypothetical protein
MITNWLDRNILYFVYAWLAKALKAAECSTVQDSVMAHTAVSAASQDHVPVITAKIALCVKNFDFISPNWNNFAEGINVFNLTTWDPANMEDYTTALQANKDYDRLAEGANAMDLGDLWQLKASSSKVVLPTTMRAANCQAKAMWLVLGTILGKDHEVVQN